MREKSKEEIFDKKPLSELFCPPEGSTGVFGLICGLSAEEAFMDSVLEQFTNQNRKRRLIFGKCFLTLFLDPRNKPMSLPGIYSPWLLENKWPNKNTLMHAKMALLGFGMNLESKTPDYYRLIVSTGNWTKEAVNKSINIVWYCDFDTKSKDNQRQSSKDINEAVEFCEKLTEYYCWGSNADTGIIDIKKRLDTFFEGIINAIKPPERGYKSRFISSLKQKQVKINENFREDSIGANVIDKFISSGIRRNFIVCGSGFFEQTKSDGKDQPEPEVLINLIKILTEKGILAKSHEKWLVINPETSGAAGQWIKNKSKEGKKEEIDWDLPRAKHPFEKIESLHAKYIYIANHNKGTGSLTSGLLYLGSGNLSMQGFALGPGTGGNIEAGVIIETKDFNLRESLCSHLGIDPENFLDPEKLPDKIEDETNEDNLKDKTFQNAPPILSCIFKNNAGVLIWTWNDTSYLYVSLDGKMINSDMDQMPVEEGIDLSMGIKLKAKKNVNDYEWTIPVFMENGRFCLFPQKIMSCEEILEELEDFHLNSVENDDESDDGRDESDVPRESTGNSQGDDISDLRNQYHDYPLNFATSIVEKIASQNQLITESQIDDWCDSLRRILLEGVGKNMQGKLDSLGINFMDVLKDKEGFAPKVSNEEYKKTIENIIVGWGLDKHIKLED